MCLSKSSVGFRAVSKVTSTNCWHSWIESTTKAQRNLHCLVKQNTPHIPAERKDTKWLFAIFDDLKSKQDLWIFSSWVLQFQVQLGYKPNSYSICLEALASPLKTGPEFMNSSPGSWWITCFSQDYWNVGGGKKDPGITQWHLGCKNQRSILDLITGIMTALNTAFLHAD